MLQFRSRCLLLFLTITEQLVSSHCTTNWLILPKSAVWLTTRKQTCWQLCRERKRINTAKQTYYSWQESLFVQTPEIEVGACPQWKWLISAQPCTVSLCSEQDFLCMQNSLSVQWTDDDQCQVLFLFFGLMGLPKVGISAQEEETENEILCASVHICVRQWETTREIER